MIRPSGKAAKKLADLERSEGPVVGGSPLNSDDEEDAFGCL